MSIFCKIDDKHVPIHRILWISDLPHFCGSADCQKEGQYEVRLDAGESLWAATPAERDDVLAALEAWGDDEPPEL